MARTSVTIPDTLDQLVAACTLFYNALPDDHRVVLDQMAEVQHRSVPSMIAYVWTRAILDHLQAVAGSRSAEEQAVARAKAHLDALHQEDIRLVEERHARRMANLREVDIRG